VIVFSCLAFIVVALCALVYACYRAFARWSELQHPHLRASEALQLHVLLHDAGSEGGAGAGGDAAGAARIYGAVRRCCSRVRIQVRCWREQDVQRSFASEPWSSAHAHRACIALPAIVARHGGVGCSTNATDDAIARIAAEVPSALQRGYVVSMFYSVHPPAAAPHGRRGGGSESVPRRRRGTHTSFASDPCFDVIASPAGHTHAIWLVDACARALAFAERAPAKSPSRLQRRIARAWSDTLCGGPGGRLSFFSDAWGKSCSRALVSPVARVAALLPSPSSQQRERCHGSASSSPPTGADVKSDENTEDACAAERLHPSDASIASRDADAHGTVCRTSHSCMNRGK